MKTIGKYLLVVFLIGNIVAPIPLVRASAVVGATEPTQILNNIQLLLSYIEHVEQTIQQAQQLRNQFDSYAAQLQNMTKLDYWNWATFTSLLDDLADNVRAGQKYAYIFDKVADEMKSQNTPDGTHIAENMNPDALKKDYAAWKDANIQTVADALAFVQVSRDDIKADKVKLQTITDKVQATDSEMSAIQAAAVIAGAQATQLLKLREAMLAQIKMVAELRKQEVAMETAAQEAREKTLGDETDHPRVQGDTYSTKDFHLK